VPAARRRPNVLLVFMDDHTHWAIGALGSRQVQTPNLDRLAARGTAFTHAVNQGSWTGAVCVAARAMLISGRTLFHARAAVEDRPGERDVPLLGEALGAAGYRTFFTGKWHNPEAALRRSYQRIGPYDGAMLVPAPFPDGSRDIGRPAPGNTWDPTDPAGGGHWMTVDGRIVHSSERWIDAALDFVGEAAGGPDPFFLHVALHAPHDPRQAPQRWLGQYPIDQVALPPNLLPEHPFDQGDRLVRDELLAPFPRTPDAIRLHRQEYLAIVSHADEQIGRLLDDLERRGLADDTIVVFSGDHGLALGEHGLMGKQSLYDHSVRVPLLLAGPGIPAGQRLDHLVYQASIFATVCEMVGVPVPPTVEFPSLAPFIGGAEAGDETVFCAYRHLQRAVRTRRWALIAYRTARRLQLFDVEADPWQAQDLSGAPGHADVVTRLLGQLRRRQGEVGDDCGSWTADIDESWCGEPTQCMTTAR
jgi:choline-sulfatase